MWAGLVWLATGIYDALRELGSGTWFHKRRKISGLAEQLGDSEGGP
jgi:hypothetical protein